MIKYAALFAIAVLIFCGTLLGAAFMSGDIDQSDLDALFGGQPTEQVVAEQPPVDELNATARMLREREDALEEREARLNEREARLNQQQADLKQLLNQLQQTEEQIQASLQKAEELRQENLTEISESLQAMEADKAAAALAALLKEQPDVVTEVVKQIPTRKRGAILNEMPPDDSRELFMLMQDPIY